MEAGDEGVGAGHGGEGVAGPAGAIMGAMSRRRTVVELANGWIAADSRQARGLFSSIENAIEGLGAAGGAGDGGAGDGGGGDGGGGELAERGLALDVRAGLEAKVDALQVRADDPR